MKKLIFSVVLLIMAASSLYAQGGNLKVLIFADTYDDRIGDGEAVSVKKVTAFIERVHAITDLPIEDDYKIYKGYSCNPDTLRAVVTQLKCTDNDVVLFCYMGHGVRALNEASKFPQMCLGSDDEEDFVPLEWVKNQLANKGPRLCVVIGDCCNTYGDWVSEKDYTALGSGNTALASSQINVISKLFNEEGIITICASKRGEKGWVNLNNGSFLMNTFMSTIEKMPVNKIGKQNIWKSVMDQVYSTLSDARIFGDDGQYHSMHPQWDIEPRRKTTTTPPPPTPRTEVAGDLESAMKQLSQISFAQKDKMVVEVMNRFFDNNAWIRVVGQNGTLMQKVRVTEYLDGLYTKNKLFKVVVRNKETNSSGKITTLTVHEMYME